MTKKPCFTKIFTRLGLITIGSFIYALALQGFLLPNDIMDGGITGISILLSEITGLSLPIFIILLNIPFLFFAYKSIGVRFGLFSFYGVVCLSLATALFSNIPAFTNDMLLTTIIGGGILGIGLGIVIRFGATMDGSEILAVVLTKKSILSVGSFIMAFNVFVFVCGGFIFSWETAMYSVLSYIIAAKMLDNVAEGFSEMKSFHIITSTPKELGDAIVKEFGKTVTYLNAKGGFSGEEKEIIYTVISRLEESKMKDLINDIDEHAFVSITNVSEVKGRLFREKNGN